jgi:glycosyltransferase involved in cell wall biosynthesis
MRILFVNSGADLYGASRSLLRLTTRLRADGHEVMVVLPCDGPLRMHLEKSGISTAVQNSLSVVTRSSVQGAKGIPQMLWDIPKSFFSLYRLAWKFLPDILHTNTAVILTSGLVARALRIPHVWHVREFFSEFSRLWHSYQWYMFCLADQILCISEAVADQFHPHIRRTRVQELYDGIPRGEYAVPSRLSVEAFRNQHGLDGHFVVGVVGRIKVGRKGQDVVVRAARQLCPKYPRLRFVFIGTPFPGNEIHLENLHAMVKEYGLEDRIIFAGECEEMATTYSAFDISLMPSAFPEPFGNVVSESMAMGRAVIGSRCGGIAEQIEHGTSGLLVEPNEPIKLAEAVERLMNDEALRLRLEENGRARYLERFEFEAFYAKVLAVYSAVRGKRSS